MGKSFFKSYEFKDYVNAKEYYMYNKTESNFRVYFYSLENATNLAKNKYNNIGWDGNSYTWADE